jgi:biopolymer transport protein ExbD
VKIQDESKPYDTINVTPMLDLAYVLLVIFIVMTTASVSGLKIDLPKPSNKPSLSPPKEMRIVRIRADGSLMLNGASIVMPELESRLAAAVARERAVARGCTLRLRRRGRAACRGASSAAPLCV